MSDKVPGVKSVPGDGLSKKERRALKVAAQGSANNTQVPTDSQPSKINKAKDGTTKKVESEKPTATKNNVSLVIVDITTKTKESHAIKGTTDISKIAKGTTDTSKIAKGTTDTSKIAKGTTDTSKIAKGTTDISKAELKAERRALQEKQRLSKTFAAAPVKTKSVTKPKAPTPQSHTVPLFNHLYTDSSCYGTTYRGSSSVIISPVAGIHPAFMRLAVQYATRTVIGSNARCIALLAALKQLVVDHVTPPKQDLCRSLEQAVQACVEYLQNHSRKQSVSMSNALRHFTLRLTQIDTTIDDSKKKTQLTQWIDSFLLDDIDKAGKAISMSVMDKIKDGDVILTYGCSSLIQRILLDAHKERPSSFRCIIVDARPLFEGRHTLRILSQAGISCTYTLINGVCAIIERTTKVLLGAHALLANGSTMARTGTAQVAMVASSCNKPIMVCCETYKFCERAQVDSYVCNELGDPDALAHLDNLSDNMGDTPLRKWKDIPCLTPLNLMYDVTPPNYVTAVVTELGMLPCTSVPVILRVKQTDIA